MRCLSAHRAEIRRQPPFFRAKVEVNVTARIIFSLSALAANLLASSGAAVSPATPSDSQPKLLRSVVAFVISAAEHASPAASINHHAAQALEALTDSPYRSSLWLLASCIAVNFFLRRHSRALLRC
jgi:hypothetical protein